MLAQPSMESSLADLKEARSKVSDELVDIKNTALSITSAGHNNTTSVLNVTVMNEGSSVIAVDDIDVLVNGTLVTGSFGGKRYLYPLTSAKCKVSGVTDPVSMKVVGPWGISDQTREVNKT